MAKRIVIVGGVAGGMSAATRARRCDEHASIVVLERGGFVSFANCGLPYHIAGRIEKESSLLVATVEMIRKRFNIDARTGHEVLSIDRSTRTVHGVDRATDTPFALPYDRLILAVGATPIRPVVSHSTAPNVFELRSMEDTQAVQAYLAKAKPRRAVIVGAGFIGLEMAEALHDRGLSVSVLEKAPHVLPPLDQDIAQAVQDELDRHGIQTLINNGLRDLVAPGEGQPVSAVLTDQGKRLDTDMVLLSIGVRPNVQLAQEAGLTIGVNGAIAVDRHQRTSDPLIYAVGDATEVIFGPTNTPARVPLAGPANRQGRTAGEHAALDTGVASANVQGTAIVQVFSLACGMTGMNERNARVAGIDVDVAHILSKHHAGYYPGSKPLRLKLVYARTTGKVLGAQACGEAGVDKRIDVVSTLMHFNGSIHDLLGLDLAYAPQFGSAKDPLHLAAMVAQNQMTGAMPATTLDQLKGETLVDVRTPAEFAGGTLPGAVNIPVDDLRDRMGELDKDAPLVTFCQVGMRGYVAQRILMQHGFRDVKNLKGGFALAAMLKK
jgi:NADPH-dependent 2,4-dienoyl-CoA reductase/sulfur reductase-like enzyme/rhodanese-related sulfurtransferase